MQDLTQQLAREGIPIEIWTPITFPAGQHVRFRRIITPWGPGVHIDTAESNLADFFFMAYSPTIISDAQGRLSGKGCFRLNDLIPSEWQPTRRFLDVFVLTNDLFDIVTNARLLDHQAGEDWQWINFTIPNLDPNTSYRLAFGRADVWSQDLNITAEWTAIRVFNEVRIPSLKSMLALIGLSFSPLLALGAATIAAPIVLPVAKRELEKHKQTKQLASFVPDSLP